MKNSYATLVALFIVATTLAQVPEQIRYQAIITDATSDLVINQQVGMQISILQTTVGGTAVYVETQTPTTNANGLVSIAIGAGTPVDGIFATIDWSADTYFIKTETDPTGGITYSLTNTSQLLSVPYALHVKTATTAITAANGFPADGTNAQVLQMVEDVPTWITLSVFYKDTDGDSFGDINSAMVAGAAPNGYIGNNKDCNDSDPDEFPGQTWYIDADGDGYGGSSIVACARVTNGFLLSELLGSGTDDCNDDNANEYPGQTWYIDADGDNFGGSSVVACARVANGFLLSELSGSGTDDCNDIDPNKFPGQTWYIGVDADSDGYIGSITSVIACENPGVGYANTQQTIDDCNDADPDEYPGQTWYVDADADGYGGSIIVACGRVANGFLLSELSGSGTDDCDDSDPLVNNLNQTWYIDADGDNFGGSSIVACVRPVNGFLLSELSGSGTDDCNDINPAEFPGQTWYIDADGDGYGGSSIVACVRAVNGFLLSELTGSGTDDCEDTDPTINPATVWYADFDGDGYGRGNYPGQTGCTSTLINATQDNTDCRDSDPAINPASVWYADLDGDGYGDPSSSEIGCISTLINATLDNTDCDDTDPTVNPTTVWYADLDGDGYGDMTNSETGCTSTLTNATQDNTDCNDGNPAIYPGRREIAGDGIDNNCDGTIDELDIGQFLGGGIVFWVDPTDNTRSLVCAIKDQSAAIPWYNGYNTAVNDTETAIKTGASNTPKIIRKYGDIATNYAAGIAKAYTYQSSDWFLPSKNTLNEMYLNSAAINSSLSALGGVAQELSGMYWSSSEYNSARAWGQSLTDGIQSWYLKSSAVVKVRAVREYPNYIGQIMDDGVVVYLTDNATTDLDGDGDYDLGLICAFSDYAEGGAWGCLGVELTLPSQIGAGMQNTTNILINCPTAPAALAARSLGANWFLPSEDELNAIYSNRIAINAALTALGDVAEELTSYTQGRSLYWSSTPLAPYEGLEVGASAVGQDFFFGTPYFFARYDRLNVRAVRAF